MKSNFLKIAGVKTEEEFYAKYPTEEAFFSEHPEAMQMKHGGAVDLNAFYNQPRFVQTNIMQDGGAYYDDSRDAWIGADGSIGPNGPYEFAMGGAMLPEFQWAGEYMNQNQFSFAPKSPSVVMLPDQQKIWHQNQQQWGTPPAGETIKVSDNEAGATNFTGAAPTGAGTQFIPGQQQQQTTPQTPIKVGNTNAGVTNFTGSAPVSNNAIDLSGAKGPKVNEKAPFKMPGQEAPAGYAAWRDKQMAANPVINASVPNPNNMFTPETVPPASNPPAAGTTPATSTTNKTATGQPGVTSMWQPVADHQIFNGKMYRNLSNMATMPLYNPAMGMMSEKGLSGYIKMGLGALSGISGMATGLDNIWRGFKGRKPEPGQPIKADIKDAGVTNFTGNQPPVNATPIDLSGAKGPIQSNPVAWQTRPQQIPGIPTKAYGGTMYKAENGVDLTKKPEFDPTKVTVGPTQTAVDLQGGLNRALGANMGISMFNNTLGFKQGMKAVRENTVKAGMTDFAYQPDDTNWMPMGYDTLNTGPGQTQAPNLYTPVQYAGVQMASQYEEGGEYDLTEEEIQQILAAGGEVEFM